MSRIAGILGPIPDNQRREYLDTMLSSYRSGSVSYVVSAGRAGLAWRGWRPPNMATAQGTSVVMDGAIFNRDELEAAVQERGNDARLFLSLYKRHGFEEAISRINGDFAIAVSDAEAGRLYLGRDRFGLKPLYYILQDGILAFASQPRALLALPDIDWRPDPSFVALFAGSHYRTFDNAIERSAYREIQQVPAACLLEILGDQVGTRRYWHLAPQEEFSRPERALAEQYRELLLDSVARRKSAAHRPAFTLSGGLDSSSVLTCAAATSNAGQHAFSSVYVDATFDETAEIQSMLTGRSVAEWHRVPVEESLDIFATAAAMVEIHDEPVATATWLSHYLICDRVSRSGFGALFGGLGGDELNAGEYEYFPVYFADLQRSGNTAAYQHEVACWAKHHDHPIHRKSPEIAASLVDRLTDAAVPGKCLPDFGRLRRYASAVNPDLLDLTHFEPIMDHPFPSYLNNRTYQDLFRETTPCCLRAEDRQTTAFSLDRFDPFLDYRLAEFMFRVPGHMKIRDGITKRLLREAMAGLLPEETRGRIKKTGWNAPAHIWFTGRNLANLRDMIASRSFRERGIYKPDVVEKIADEHDRIVAAQEPRENHMMFLWQLINLETWLSSLDDLSRRRTESL